MKTGRIVNSVIEGVASAISEIEEMRLQLALGKLETVELYESNKKKFKSFLSELEKGFEEFKKEKEVQPFIHALEHLHFQLMLGKAETKIVFEEQYKKITEALRSLDQQFKNKYQESEKLARFKLEVEKFKIKLELIHLHYELNKVRTEFEIKNKKNDFFASIDRIKEKIKEKENSGKEKWEHFQDEMNEAYTHLRNAFKG